LDNDRCTRLLRQGSADLGVDLTNAQLGQFRTYHDELTDWHSRLNLTRVTEWNDVVTRHYLDSLTARLALSRNMIEGGRFIDIGSGAGLPGVPLKIAFPGLRATLLEATGKKAAFLEHLVARLGLQDVEVRAGRAETLGHQAGFREGFDFVVARAVSGMAALAELALPFCRLGGRVIAYKTRCAAAEIRGAVKAISATGGELAEVIEVSTPELGDERRLVVLRKVANTPERYPRRPGMPAKRPL
jgi:16S rRNA (guanine527-N7)-methyltransferase